MIEKIQELWRRLGNRIKLWFRRPQNTDHYYLKNKEGEKEQAKVYLGS